MHKKDENHWICIWNRLKSLLHMYTEHAKVLQMCIEQCEELHMCPEQTKITAYLLKIIN